MGTRDARPGSRLGQSRPGARTGPELRRPAHRSRGEKRLKTKRTDFKSWNEKISERVLSLQQLQLIDRFVPDPGQAATLIIWETTGCQHFFAMQNHAAFAFNEEGACGIGGTYGVRSLRMRRGNCQIQHVRGTSLEGATRAGRVADRAEDQLILMRSSSAGSCKLPGGLPAGTSSVSILNAGGLSFQFIHCMDSR